MPPSCEYSIELITEEDRSMCRNFIIKYFMPDEPILRSVGLIDFPQLDEFFMGGIGHHCSFKAVTKVGEIIGLIFSVLRNRPLPGEPIKKSVDSTDDERWKIECILKDHINENYNVFDAYPNCNIVVESRAVCVNPKYRGQGIGVKLLQRLLQHMKENNYPVMKRVCTSYYSGQVMEKAGLKEVFRVEYKNFKVDGKVLINLPEPHTACRVFIAEV